MMKLFWPQRNFEEALAQLQQQRLQAPFSEDILQFTQSLSKHFLQMRHMPEVVALGYWLRKANVKAMQQQFEQQHAGKLVRPRGIVFHIAPSNVDTIFVYSWMLSLFAGNKNIIRLSSKAEVNDVLQVILDVLPEFPALGERTMICTYGHDEQAGNVLSKVCHTRVIWGGDATIEAVRRIPLAPMANELAFPDRFSVALLNSEEVLALDESELDALVERFYNDVFWFDQLACSSPRLVIWQGACVETFWSKFEQKIQQKQYELVAATQVLKYTTSLQLAAEPYVEQVAPTMYFSRVHVADMPANARELHCGGGLFYECSVETLDEAAKLFIDKDQTIAYYGFTNEQLHEFVTHIQTRGIDRVVPVGQALDFNGIWDGQSFLTSFTREVTII